MLQRLLHRDALARVEHQHALNQVDGQRVRLGVEAREGHAGGVGQGADVAARLLAGDEVQVVLVGRADEVDDELELVDVVLAGEQRLAAQQLREDAAHGPHVDGEGVLVAGEQQLGRAVPPRDDVLGHEALLGAGAREAKVADLEVAARVEQQVGRLEVAVQHVGRVDVLEAAQELTVGEGEGRAREERGSQGGRKKRRREDGGMDGREKEGGREGGREVGEGERERGGGRKRGG